MKHPLDLLDALVRAVTTDDLDQRFDWLMERAADEGRDVPRETKEDHEADNP